MSSQEQSLPSAQFQHEISPANKTPPSSSTSIFSGLENLVPPALQRSLPPMIENKSINFTASSTWKNEKPFQFSAPVQIPQDSNSKLVEIRQGNVNFPRFIANDGPFKYSAGAFDTLNGLGNTSLIEPVEVFEATALERDALFKQSVKLQEGSHALQHESKSTVASFMEKRAGSEEQHSAFEELHKKETNDIYNFLGWQDNEVPFATRVIQYLQGQNELVKTLVKKNKDFSYKAGELESQIMGLKEQVNNGIATQEQVRAKTSINIEAQLNTDLVSKINKAEARDMKIQGSRKLEIKEVAHRLEESTGTCTKCSSQLTQAKEKIKEIESVHKQEIVAMEIQLRELRGRGDDLNSQLSEAKKKIKKLTTSLDDLINERRITLSAHVVEIKDLTKKLAEANDEADAAWNIVDDERKEHEEAVINLHKKYEVQTKAFTSEESDSDQNSEQDSNVDIAPPERTTGIPASEKQIEDAISEVNSKHEAEIADTKASHERILEDIALEKESLETKHHEATIAHEKELADIREVLQAKIDILTTEKIELEEEGHAKSEMYNYQASELEETLAPFRDEISILTEQRDILQKKLSKYSTRALKMESNQSAEIAEMKASFQQQIKLLSTRNKELEEEAQILTSEKQELMDTSSTLISATGDAIEDLRVKEIVLQEEFAFKDAQAREITEFTEEHMEATQKCIRDLESKANAMEMALKSKDNIIASLQSMLVEQTTTVETYIAEVDNASNSSGSRNIDANALNALSPQIVLIDDHTLKERIDKTVEERVSQMVNDIILGLNSAKMAIPQQSFDEIALVPDDFFSHEELEELEGMGDLRNHIGKDPKTANGIVPAINDILTGDECLSHHEETDSTLLADKKPSLIPESASLFEHAISHERADSNCASAEEECSPHENMTLLRSKKAEGNLSCSARIAYTIHIVLWLVAVVSLHCYARSASTDISPSLYQPVPNISIPFTYMPSSFSSVTDLSTKSTGPGFICWGNESAFFAALNDQLTPGGTRRISG